MTLRVEGTPGQGAASIQPFEIHIAPLNLQGEFVCSPHARQTSWGGWQKDAPQLLAVPSWPWR